MTLWMMGSAGTQAPFNRTFFNVALGELLGPDKSGRAHRLLLHLVDGTPLDVRSIETLSEYYFIVRACGANEDSAKVPLHVLPYGAIYRIELDDRSDEENRRLGFQWAPMEERLHQVRRGRARGELSSVTGEGVRSGNAESRASSPDP